MGTGCLSLCSAEGSERRPLPYPAAADNSASRPAMAIQRMKPFACRQNIVSHQNCLTEKIIKQCQDNAVIHGHHPGVDAKNMALPGVIFKKAKVNAFMGDLPLPAASPPLAPGAKAHAWFKEPVLDIKTVLPSKGGHKR